MVEELCPLPSRQFCVLRGDAVKYSLERGLLFKCVVYVRITLSVPPGGLHSVGPHSLLRSCAVKVLLISSSYDVDTSCFLCSSGLYDMASLKTGILWKGSWSKWSLSIFVLNPRTIIF